MDRGRSASEPLGPSSLAWRYFSDGRGMLVGLWAGSTQNMHPGLGAWVEEHSTFFDERWEWLFRSLYPIAGVVYDGSDASRTARAVRDYHLGIKGTDRHGRPYHALDPDTFFWAHATFVMVPVLVCRHFGRALTEEQKERLSAESLQWYRLYGVSDRPAPADWRGFCAYFDRMCAEVLESTSALPPPRVSPSWPAASPEPSGRRAPSPRCTSARVESRGLKVEG
ncbi:oxygenase MpaB family protein [Streptomyces sp. NPDC090798]|uniref:oxygenase MpaB family protein n=1 Tax=Streptomyces sp. NPDC090798 TaxID=3365968 RepID=UPI003823ADA0